MSGNIAINPETGEMLVISPQGQWVPPQRARNPETGAEVFYDGAEWRPIPAARRAPAEPSQAAPPPGASGSSFLRGIDELQGSGYSAIEGVGNITGIGALQRFGREGRIRNEQEAQQSLPDSQRMTFEQAQGIGQNVRAAGQAFGMSLPSMAPGLAGAATGAALGSVVPGVGTVVGGVLGGAAASLPLFFGTNRQRQLQANPDQPVDEGRAALTAIPQALSEGVVDRVSLGLGRVLGIGADAVARNVIPRILRGIGVGAATEVPAEVFQQVLERAQAGLDILDSEAMAEYREAAIASAVVGGGIGGGFAALPGRNPPAGPRTREEDEALRGAIDTVTGERDYLDETQRAFDEVERQREARDRANRFPDIRNVDPEIYAAENPIIAANMAAELIDIRDRKVRSDGELGLPGLVEEAKAARSDLAVIEQAASAAGVAPQDDPAYQSAKARYDDLNEQISVLQNRIAYLSARVDPRIAAAGPIAELTQAQQNLNSLKEAQKDVNKRLKKAQESSPVNLGDLESIQTERADLFKKVQDQQREILKLQRLIPEDQRQITARENKKGFAKPAFGIAGARGERRKADAEATDLRAGAAPFADDILLINPKYNDEGRLENGEVVTRLDTPADDGSVVAYVNRLIGGKEQEVAVPANVNDILRIKRLNAGISERETDRTKQTPSARLTQEAAAAEFGPEQILGPFIGPAVDPNQMDLNPRRVTDRVGGQNTGTASPEPDYVAPRAPAPAPKAPSTKGVLPQGDDQQQTSTIVPPSEQVSSFNMPLGKVFTIVTPDASMKVNVVPEIVDLKSLTAAHGEFQNRETENVANKSTIARIANNPKFELLTTSPYSDRGTPVVGPDNMVEAGNHRVKGLKEAAESNPEGFAGYVQSLRNAGYSIPEGVSYPVLIRRRVSELTHDERVRFCDLSNKEASQSFTAQETAEGDAKLINNDLMKLLKGDLTDGILAAGNAPFVRAFLKEVLTTNEYNEAVNDKGGISPALEARITNALFFYAYKNKSLLSRLTNRRDDKTTKKIISGLASATGAMHTLRQGIEGFNIRPEFDIIEKLVEATDRIRTAITDLDTADGRKEAIRNIFNTKDLVKDITPLDLAAVRIFLNEEKDGIASAGKIAERLKDYVDRAETQTTTKDLVGGEKRITPEEALTQALKPGETLMLSSLNVPAKQDVEADAESRERKSPPEVEQALTLIKARLDALRAKGSQGAALAKAYEDALANRKLNANQIYAAFTVDEALLQTMPKGANYEFQFLHDLALTDRDVAEKAGVKLGTKLQGMKVAPAKDGLPGLIQLSLSDDMLPLLSRTAFHEAFHVLQDYFAAYDKGFKAAVDKHFKDGMKVTDFEPSIKRRLQAMKPPDSDQSYWDLLVEGLGDGEIAHGYEAQAHAFGALADAAMRGQKVVGLLPPFQRFFNFLRDTMAALRSGFTGDGFKTPASLLGKAGERAAKYDQQTPRTAGQSYSALEVSEVDGQPKPTGAGQNDLFAPQTINQPDPFEENYIKNIIERRNAELVYRNDKVALLDAYSVTEKNNRLYSKQHYVGMNLESGRATPIAEDIENYSGDVLDKSQIDFLIKKKLEHKQKVKNQIALNPRGPFKGNSNIAFDTSFPKELRGFAEGLINELGINDVPIFFTDLRSAGDAKFVSRNNLFGKYASFRQAQAYKNTRSFGLSQGGLPFGGWIGMNLSGARKSLQMEVLAHEIGHIYDGHVLQKADKATQDEVFRAFNQWMSKNKTLPANQYVVALRAAILGRKTAGEVNPNLKGKDLDPYFTSYSEWFADQVSKWGTTSVTGQSLVARFFRRIAKAYQKIVSALGQNGLPDQTVVNFIENHRKMKSVVSIFSAPPIPGSNAKKSIQTTIQFVSEVNSIKGEETPQFSALKAPRKPTTTSPQAGSLNAAGNAQAFYNSVVKRVDTPNVFDSVLAYMFDKKPGEKISAAIARTSVNAAAPLHAFAAMASKNGYTGLSAGRALELQMSNSGRINQILNAGMGKLNARTGEITLRNDVKPLLQIMGEADVGNDATKKGWLQTYLVALRERDLRKVNRRVFTDTEDQTITDTIKNIEAKYPQFKQTAADLDKLNKALIEFALEAGLITKQHASVLSSKFYTPAYREDVDQISNALNVQLGGGVKSINDLYSNIILNADSIMKASLKNLAMKTAAETMKFANVGRENTTGTKGDNTISYRSNGKKIDFDVDDPVLFSALTSMPRETINGIYQAMASTASFFRDLITVAPSFMLKNLYAGKISAYVQEGAPLLANTFGGVRDALKNTTTLQNFQMQTGFGGMEWGMKPKDMVKTFERRLTDKGMMEAISRGSVFSALRQGFTKLQALSEASEMAERIKLSEHLIKKGMSPKDAYFQAYLIAPYSRKGTGAGWLGHTVHFMAPLIPFLNAKIQTTYRLLENEKGDKTIPILKIPQQIFLRGLVLSAFSTAVYALNLADDEEEWDGRPNYMKLNYDIIPFTSGLVTLPRAYEIGKIFGGLPVFFLDAIRREEGRDLTEALIQVAVSTVWVTPIPKAMEPIIGAVTNYDFFRKQPHESAGEQGLPIQERVRRSTTSIAKGVSAGFNSVFGDSLSPIQAQAVLEGYTGTVGTMIMAGFDSLLSAAGAIPSKPAGAFGDPLSMPAIIASTVGLNTFYRDPDSMTSRFVNDFYRIKEMTDQLVRSQTLATNARDYERLQELRGEEGLPLRMRPAVNAASTRIADLNKRIRLIEGGRLESIEKTEAIQPLIAQRDRIARQVVDQARNLGVL
jgi:hypothetical protein